jgi:hypothetical protein
VANVNYTLPFAADATGLKAGFLKDWRLGVLFRYRSGYPFSPISGVDTGMQVQGWAPEFPDLRPGADSNPHVGAVNQWFDPTAFVLPAAGYIGNAGRNTIIGPDFKTLDMNLGKSLPMGGSRALELRIEAFNLFNRANFGLPQATIFNADGSYRSDAGRITSTVGSARQVQLGVRFVF